MGPFEIISGSRNIPINPEGARIALTLQSRFDRTISRRFSPEHGGVDEFRKGGTVISIPRSTDSFVSIVDESLTQAASVRTIHINLFKF